MTRQERAEIETQLQQIARTLAEHQRRLDEIDATIARLETR